MVLLKKVKNTCAVEEFFSRVERIRTSDFVLPKHASYQAGPLPEWGPESNRHQRCLKPLPYH